MMHLCGWTTFMQLTAPYTHVSPAEMQPTQTSVELLLMQSGFSPGGTDIFSQDHTPDVTMQHAAPSFFQEQDLTRHLPTPWGHPLYPPPAELNYFHIDFSGLVLPTTGDQIAAPHPSSLSCKPQTFPYAQPAFSPRAVQNTSTNVNFASSLKLHTQDEAKPPTDESVIGKHFIIGAESVLEGIQGKQTVIETAFVDFQISRTEYAVLAGFNEAHAIGTGYCQRPTSFVPWHRSPNGVPCHQTRKDTFSAPWGTFRTQLYVPDTCLSKRRNPSELG
jgi:hypothetical protein